MGPAVSDTIYSNWKGNPVPQLKFCKFEFILRLTEHQKTGPQSAAVYQL